MAEHTAGHSRDYVPGPWHIRAIRLPHGDAPEEWWIVDGRISETPVPGARDLPGGWWLPGGLVDSHMHGTMNFNGHVLADGSAALIAANLEAQRAAGVLAVRDAGLAYGGRYGSLPEAGPRVQSAGRLIAAPGRGYPGICVWATAEQLLEVARDEVRQGAAWVKIMADFPGPDGDWYMAPPSYPLDLLQAVVRAVHDAGARVMAHSTGLAASDLIRAGVDSIEHGMLLNGTLLEQMAERRIAWSLTLGTALKYSGPIAAQESPAGRYVRGHLERVREQLPLAAALGVPLLAGTDELPHGALAQEIAIIHKYGLTTSQALAATSTAARDFLRLPAFAPDAPVDLVMYDTDPRQDLRVLAHPSAIIFDGRRIG